MVEHEYVSEMIVYDWKRRHLLRVPYVHCKDAGFDTSVFGYCFSPPVIPQKSYKVVCYDRFDPEPEDMPEPLTRRQAESEREHWKFLQPENIYKIEEIEDYRGGV